MHETELWITKLFNDYLAGVGNTFAVNLGLLERLPEGAWDRVGLHAERGEESIRSLVTTYAGHDRVHLAQIETIRTGLFPRAGKRRAARKPAKKAHRQAVTRR